MFLEISQNSHESTFFTEHLRATVSIKRRTMLFSAYKNRISKVKLWRVGTHERKTRTIFCTVYFVIFLYRLFVLFQYIEYWIHFQNIDTFAYQKTLFQTLFARRIAFSVSLSTTQWSRLNGYTYLSYYKS